MSKTVTIDLTLNVKDSPEVAKAAHSDFTKADNSVLFHELIKDSEYASSSGIHPGRSPGYNR